MTKNETTLLHFLTDNGFEIFSKDQLSGQVDLSDQQLDLAIINLLRGKRILSLERGKYCVYGFSDTNVIGCFLAQNSCISYWTAMNYHGLTEQIPNTVFVQTDRQKKKSEKNILGVDYQFVWLKKEKVFGYKTEGYGNQVYRISDKEKTILDCFDKPRYSGGYPEIVKAFYNANLNVDKLIRYCSKMKNKALIRRLGFLAELFGKKNLEKFIQYAQKKKSKKIYLFEHNGAPKGRINKQWGLIMNIEKEELMNMATS